MARLRFLHSLIDTTQNAGKLARRPYTGTTSPIGTQLRAARFVSRDFAATVETQGVERARLFGTIAATRGMIIHLVY